MFAYIPARAGSIRIKNKNIKNLYGKPILEITINNLKKLKFIDNIFVSTDSLKIKKIAEKSGAKVLGVRDKKLSNSKAGTMDLIKYDIPRHCKFQNDKNVLFVHSTSILVKSEIYNICYKKFIKLKPNVLMPCNKSKPFWSLKKVGHSWKPIFPKLLKINSQNLPETVIDAGQFYFFNNDKVKRFDSIKNVANTYVYPISDIYSVDVDTLEDWKDLKFKYNLLNKNEK
jgi:CMP-N-acetylneuraminic acid synthetase